jgi:hypothetical protein
LNTVSARSKKSLWEEEVFENEHAGADGRVSCVVFVLEGAHLFVFRKREVREELFFLFLFFFCLSIGQGGY